MRIDFVSDVVCPWCAIGLQSLESALERIGAEIPVELHFRPFELNPDMPPEGEDIGEHLTRKYGSTPAQQAKNREHIRARGEEVGFTFRLEGRSRTWNTFDAHRLLLWADLEGRQRELKHALLKAYFTDGENPSSHGVLVKTAVACGLDGARAAAILASGEYAEEVRAEERYYAERGITAVPSVVIDDQHLIQGGQPAEVFEAALRQIAASTVTA